MTRARLLLALTAVLLVLSGTGCAQTRSVGIAAPPRPLTIATTMPVLTTDPVAALDAGSQSLVINSFQRLMFLRTGGDEIKPDLARDCMFVTETTYSCQLRADQRFSNGDPVTSADVKFSIERLRTIPVPGSPAAGLGALARIETRGPLQVDFQLSRPDNAFAQVLASPVASIVDSRLYSPTQLWPADQLPVGSGPYAVVAHSLEETLYRANPDYKKGFVPATDQVLVKTFHTPELLHRALVTGSVDIGWRVGDPPPGTDLAASALPGGGFSRLIWQPGSPLRTDAALRSRVRAALSGVRTTRSLVPSTVVDATDTLDPPGPVAAGGAPVELRVATGPAGGEPVADAQLARALEALRQAGITVREVPAAEADVLLTSAPPQTDTLVAWLQPWWEHPLPGRAERIGQLLDAYRREVDARALRERGAALLAAATEDDLIVPLGQYDLGWFATPGIVIEQKDNNWLGSTHQLGLWGWVRRGGE